MPPARRATQARVWPPDAPQGLQPDRCALGRTRAAHLADLRPAYAVAGGQCCGRRRHCVLGAARGVRPAGPALKTTAREPRPEGVRARRWTRARPSSARGPRSGTRLLVVAGVSARALLDPQLGAAPEDTIWPGCGRWASRIPMR